jgi:hypothetical protein
MSKNIVIFSDGTGQKGGEKDNTNVYKMFNMIQDRIYKTKERSWDIEKHGPPTIHHTVKKRNLNLLNEKSSPYESWILKLKNHIIEGNNN